MYWANETGGSIGRATPAGGAVDQRFVTGATAPRGVAVDGRHVYWAHGAGAGRIGRASLAGTGADHSFLSVGASPGGVAVDNKGIYWTHSLLGSGHVGQAALDGSRPNPMFVPIRSAPCGVAIDPDKLYWANPGRPGSIGRSHGRSDVGQAFVRHAGDPCGVAVTDTHVYWTSRAGNAIGRARRDGTRVQRRFISAFRPCGVAVTGTHVYWSTGRGTIGRATRGGRRADQAFVTGARGPCGVAVDATVRAVPRAHRFARTRARRRGAIRAFLLVNTSSSPLAVSRIRIVGRDRRDFAKTGDSCTVNVVPAGGGCVFNVRFTPSARGLRRARLRVTGSAANAPLHIAISGTATR